MVLPKLRRPKTEAGGKRIEHRACGGRVSGCFQRNQNGYVQSVYYHAESVERGAAHPHAVCRQTDSTTRINPIALGFVKSLIASPNISIPGPPRKSKWPRHTRRNRYLRSILGTQSQARKREPAYLPGRGRPAVSRAADSNSPYTLFPTCSTSRPKDRSNARAFPGSSPCFAASTGGCSSASATTTSEKNVACLDTSAYLTGTSASWRTSSWPTRHRCSI